jgi:hypothetical protein
MISLWKQQCISVVCDIDGNGLKDTNYHNPMLCKLLWHDIFYDISTITVEESHSQGRKVKV